MKPITRSLLLGLALLALTPGCFPEPSSSCSQAVAGTACNPDDPGAVYRVNECDEFLDTLKTCQPGTMCGQDPAFPTQTTCVEDPASCEGDDYKACNPNDPDAVYLYNKYGSPIS